ncbi:hypothetical protein AB0K12_11730 [Nonomuraea sp. NPDC049419]|uniref:coiled-coil domain-containing protein n=1 Tax=Nonomuraea sp. NPDC049419 TaxID=3155772 RepID=UPI003430C494
MPEPKPIKTGCLQGGDPQGYGGRDAIRTLIMSTRPEEFGPVAAAYRQTAELLTTTITTLGDGAARLVADGNWGGESARAMLTRMNRLQTYLQALRDRLEDVPPSLEGVAKELTTAKERFDQATKPQTHYAMGSGSTDPAHPTNDPDGAARAFIARLNTAFHTGHSALPDRLPWDEEPASPAPYLPPPGEPGSTPARPGTSLAGTLNPTAGTPDPTAGTAPGTPTSPGSMTGPGGTALPGTVPQPGTGPHGHPGSSTLTSTSGVTAATAQPGMTDAGRPADVGRPAEIGRPSTTRPTGVGPTGVGPTGVGPTGVGPTGVGPTGVGPTGVLPETVAPARADPGLVPHGRDTATAQGPSVRPGSVPVVGGRAAAMGPPGGLGGEPGAAGMAGAGGVPFMPMAAGAAPDRQSTRRLGTRPADDDFFRPSVDTPPPVVS